MKGLEKLSPRQSLNSGHSFTLDFKRLIRMKLATLEKGGICQGPKQMHTQNPSITCYVRWSRNELQRPNKNEACKSPRMACGKVGRKDMGKASSRM